MGQPFGQIGTAIPRFALAGFGHETTAAEKEQLPPGLQGAHIERKAHGVARRIRRHGRLRHDPCVQRVQILVAGEREMRIGKCREQMRSVARDAFAHGADECRLRPDADAVLRIGRDIGRIERAVLRGETETASEVLRRGVWQAVQ
jgi:hypothetical protein